AAADALASPVDVYELIRNTVRSEFYYGSMKGALQTYLESSGNDADTAALLVMMMRAKGIPARYVRSTVEGNAEALVAASGTNSVQAALRVLDRGGIPNEGIVAGGRIAAVRLDRVYAEIFVPYGNYRGTLGDDRGKVWLALDAGFKTQIVNEPTTSLSATG